MKPCLTALPCIAPALLFVVLVPPAIAQPAQLDPVIVTATRVPQTMSSQLSDVTVIDRADIVNAGNQSLLEVLQMHGGVEVARNGGPGQTAAVFIRGSNANHVVVLVDGIRINSATSGTTALENLPLDMIDRIEIVRGPASGLYGADAIGGVIQVFTRRDRTSLDAGAGSWNTRRASGSLFQQYGSLKVSVHAGYEDSNAFSATNAGNAFSFNPDSDPYRNRNASATATYQIVPGHSLTLSGLASEGVAHFDAGPSADDLNRQRLSTLAIESRNRVSPAWESTLRLARGSDDIRAEGGFPGRFRTRQDQATWQNDLAAPGGHVAAGIEWRRESVDSDTDYSRTSRTVGSAFAGYSGSAGSHLLQGALRHDDSSQFGGRSTGNVGYGYRLSPAWRASASFGTAFKAPSFNDLYYVSPFFSGNPSLRPERSTGFDAALRYSQHGSQAGLTLYQNRIRDLIAVDPTFTTVVNVAEARIRGASLRASTDIGGYRLKAEATHEEALDVGTGKMLPRRARNFGTAGVAGQSGPWRYGAEIVASAHRFDTVTNSAGSKLGGYAIVNLRGAYALTPAWTAGVRWNNVFDRDYALVRGYNTPRSNVFVNIEYATSE